MPANSVAAIIGPIAAPPALALVGQQGRSLLPPTVAVLAQIGVDFLFPRQHGGFLKQDDWSAGGRPELQDWAINPFQKILEQADRQHTLVKPHYPKVRLTWVFSSMMTKLYMYQMFIDKKMVPPIEAEVRPFEQEGYGDE